MKSHELRIILNKAATEGGKYKVIVSKADDPKDLKNKVRNAAHYQGKSVTITNCNGSRDFIFEVREVNRRKQ